MAENFTYIGVFLEGVLSFMSPCILPLIPLYMSYLTSFLSEEDKTKKSHYLKIFIVTLCFVLGICTVYFILALSIDYIRDFLTNYSDIISLIGGIILVLFALVGFGFIEIKFLNREFSLKEKFDVSGMNYLKAYLLGLVFSFAWTPCIGPMMSSVLIMAASAEALVGNLLILFYGLGFTIPFLVIALVYDFAIIFIKKYQGLLIKISKLASIIILIFGIYMIYNASNNIVTMQNNYHNLLASSNNSETVDSDKFMMYEFELLDQYGNSHTLSDYKGKYISLNFIASWCTYCIQEIDDYKAFSNNTSDEVVALYVMSDSINLSGSTMNIDEFVENYDIDIPVLYDDGTMFNYLGVSSFPTIFYIGPDGSVIGYQSGALDEAMMSEIFNIAKEMYGGE